MSFDEGRRKRSNIMKTCSILIALSCVLLQPVARAAGDTDHKKPLKDEIAQRSGADEDKAAKCKDAAKGKDSDEGDQAADNSTEGKFVGIEEGDFSHWQMKTADGKDVSYFILKPDASVEKVLENPQAFKGKRCRVRWRESMETLPDGGGKTRIEHVISVEWVEKNDF